MSEAVVDEGGGAAYLLGWWVVGVVGMWWG